MEQPQSNLILHIWPGQWNLASFDPGCLAAVAYLQLAAPGKFNIVECNNPDISPSGQLPFLVHGQDTVSTLPLIIKYVMNLKTAWKLPNANLDSHVERPAKSQIVAWCAHVESNLGDIVYYALYSHHGNWMNLTNPALASMFPVPQRYYVPGRIRDTYRSRLEAVGLWNLPEPDKEEKKPFRNLLSKEKEKEKNTRIFLEAFERDKVLEKARASLDIYSRLLGDKQYIFSSRPTSLDIVLAAHVLVLLSPEYPDPFLKTLILESYPGLVSHSGRVYAFDPADLPIQTPATREFSWMALIGRPSVRWRQQEKSEVDLHYERMRWGFLGLALGSLAAYVVLVFGAKSRLIQATMDAQIEEEREEYLEE